MRVFHKFLSVVLSLAVIGAGAAVAKQTSKSNSTPANGNASQVQYLSKPGCGPDKTDGTAGKSGTHTGQPPKDPNRQDCPTPPGQNK